MREIKFRLYDKTVKKMYHDVIVGNCEHKSVCPAVYVEHQGWVHSEICEVMQYTGLKDKNDKEIYEGDIIDISYISPLNNKLVIQRYVIEWSNGIYKATFINDKPYYDRFLWMEYNNVEVIGNTYENQELLEQEDAN